MELRKLGEGRHFGEWWGKGIQRGYGLEERRFSLFNTARWHGGNPNLPDCCHVVPMLYMGPFAEDMIGDQMATLRVQGSMAAPGFAARIMRQFRSSSKPS